MRRRALQGAVFLEQCEDRILLASILGSAQSFGVLGGQAVTNTGPTNITGDVGVSPGSAVTGFPPGVVNNGTIHAADPAAVQAQADLTTAYNTLAAMPSPPGNDLSGQDLGGQTLTPGVYHFNTSAQLTGALTLDAQGDPNAVFVFQIGSSLTTANNAAVAVVGGGFADNVYFQVGSSATLGLNTAFEGNIVALTSISLTTGASIQTGRALARNGAVTLDTNVISIPEPDLSISKTADAATINAGELAGFTIVVANAGTGAASGVVVTDPLTPGVAWTTTTPGAVIVNGVLTYSVGSLAAGASVVIHVGGATTAANGGTLVDTASVAAGNNLPGVLSATATILVNVPDLSISKTADAATINAGELAGFTITVANAGPGAAFDLHIADVLPAGIIWSVLSGPGVITGLVLTVPSITSLAPGASFSIHVVGTTATTGILSNTATASASNEPSANTANNSATATIVVEGIQSPVTIVRAIRRGIHNQPTRYVVTFSGLLDPAQATNPLHYKLVEVNARGRVIGARIGVRSSSYDPQANTVTLLPSRNLNLHLRYRLTISGLTDASSRPVVGSGGVVGGDYVTYFSIQSYFQDIAQGSEAPSASSSSTPRTISSAVVARAGNPISGNASPFFGRTFLPGHVGRLMRVAAGA